jgi:hypothetical protein
MKTLLYLLAAFSFQLSAFSAASPTMPPTRIAAGSGVTVTTNGINNFTLSASGGLGTNHLNPNQFEAGTTNVNIAAGALLTNGVFRSSAGNALTVNTNVLIVDTNSVRFGGTSVVVSNNFSAGGGTWNLGANLTLASGQGMASSGKGLIFYEADGICEFWNNAVTDFSALRFGGRSAAKYGFFFTNATAIEFKTASGSALTNIAAKNVYLQAGESTNRVKGAGALSVDTTQTGNVGAGVDTLQYYQVPANALAVNGDALTFTCAGTFGGSLNTKAITVLVGATTVFDTGALAITASGHWVLKGSITRTGAATQKCEVTLTTSDVALLSYATYSTAAVTLSGAWDFYVKGEGTDNNDIVKEIFRLNYEPAP